MEYWNCGQVHDHRNWNWKLLHNHENLCPEQGFYDFFKRDILLELLRRQLECECQLLFDERVLRKEALKKRFGIDFNSGEVKRRQKRDHFMPIELKFP